MPRYYRKVIRIKGEQSPNVKLALAQLAAGQEPTGEMILPGVLSWDDYRKRRATWDKVRQCIGLDADWWEGAELLLFPPEWLNYSERLAAGQGSNRLRVFATSDLVRYMGCDPAEGGDKSSWAIVDRTGLIKLTSMKTPDTTVITAQTLALMYEYSIDPQNVCFDRGGGGRQHVDRLKSQGKRVRSVGFGEAVTLDPKRGLRMLEEKRVQREERYAFFNRRAQMYGELSELLDPALDGFAIPAGIRGLENDPTTELRSQLAPIPKLYDRERLKLPKKHRRDKDDREMTLMDLVGHSPDEADALVLACHAMLHKGTRTIAGVI